VAGAADPLAKALAKGVRGGVWLIHGSEEWLREEAIRRLIHAHLDPATRDFNLDQIQATSFDAEMLASICQTPPMMAEWRVVIVRDAQALAANARTRSLVEELVTNCPPGLALVFSGDISAAGIWDKVKKSAIAVEYKPFAIGDVPAWLSDRAEERGVDIDAQAARALASALGAELGVLAQELAKLIDYVGERARIRIADVREIVGHIPRVNRWDWFETVASTRFNEARTSLPVLLDAESGIGLLIGLGPQLLRIGIMLTAGEHVLTEMLPPKQRWLARRIRDQAKRWNLDTLDAALDDLLRADRLLKSTSLDERQVLDELLLRMEARRIQAAA
jgi:DNA polymerase-3 subunit delta